MWFKVDDKLHDHRKVRAAGKAAMGVWVLAGSWCSDNPTGGFVPEGVISRWGNKSDAAKLVKAGLWFRDEQDGEHGWRFHQWEERNPDAETVRAIQAAESMGGTYGNHVRWHVKRGVRIESCEHCRGGIGVPDSGGESGANPPVPSPVPMTLVETNTPQSPTAGLTAMDLQNIALLTGGNEAHASRVAREILSRSSGVKNPSRYVLGAIRKEPELYRFRRGNPTKASACPSHQAEWADACRVCALEAKL